MQYTRAVPVLALLALGACQDEKPTQPTDEAKTVRVAPRSPMALSQNPMTIVDAATGLAYTFDPTTNTLSSGAKSIIIEDNTLAGQVYTQFVATGVADSEATSLNNGVKNLAGTCGPHNLDCVPAARPDAPTIHVRPGPTPTTQRRGGHRLVRQISFQRWGITIPQEFGVGFGMPGEPALPQDLGITCTSLANDIVNQTVDYYNTKRSGFLSLVFNAVFAGVTDAVFFMYPGSAEAASLGKNIADRGSAVISMGVMGAAWNSLDCGNYQVSSRAVAWGGATGTGSGYRESCDWKGWEYSFDNYLTWVDIEVWTCEISMS
jgi:hypothetical protein